MRQALKGKEEQLVFHLVQRQSLRTPPINITDLDVAEDIALISQEITQA